MCGRRLALAAGRVGWLAAAGMGAVVVVVDVGVVVAWVHAGTGVAAVEGVCAGGGACVEAWVRT